mmetsp:Transcript_87880/g.264294  ORF Transcript_87880/g.264294 Transcript_87880/m.264294 type:complete len:177 (-) Transcript_87880:305-835(-)
MGSLQTVLPSRASSTSDPIDASGVSCSSEPSWLYDKKRRCSDGNASTPSMHVILRRDADRPRRTQRTRHVESGVRVAAGVGSPKTQRAGVRSSLTPAGDTRCAIAARLRRRPRFGTRGLDTGGRLVAARVELREREEPAQPERVEPLDHVARHVEHAQLGEMAEPFDARQLVAVQV